MKKFTFLARSACMLLVISILPLTSFSQHFTPVTNAGAGNWHFYPVTATLVGVDLEQGDEIAVFDGNVCVGSHVLSGELDGSYGMAVGNDWLSYEKSGSDPGYTGGHNYIFKCWDADAGVGGTEYTGTMTYNTTYGPQDYIGATFPAAMEFRWSWIDLVFTNVAPATGDIAGTITNSVGGDDIAGALVTATGTTANVFTTTTNANGVYTFTGIDVDVYSFTVTHSLFQDQTVNNINVAESPAVNPDEDFILVYKLGTLSGFVKEADGTPIVGASVQVTGGPAAVLSGALGAYTIPGITPETYDVVATMAGFGTKTETGIVINPDATTNQDFILDASGILQGTVTDGTNAVPLNNVLVTVVEESLTFVSGTPPSNPGEFEFDLNPGTYTLTFEINNYHTETVTGVVVTAGTPNTVSDVSMYAEIYQMGDGDPYGDVWTIYLNTVTGDGAPLKNGDEIGIYTNVQETNTVIEAARGASGITATFITGAPNNIFSFASASHGLAGGDEIEIISSTDGNMVMANLQIAIVTDDIFTVVWTDAYAGAGTETVEWQNDNLLITSVGHKFEDGDEIALSGTDPDIDLTYLVENKTDDTYEIPGYFTTLVDAGVSTKTSADLVGHFSLDGPISGAGTAYALKAFKTIYGGIGYGDLDAYTFKLQIAGGGEVPMQTIDWANTNGFTDPGATFPAGSAFDMVDLDFDVPGGKFIPQFTKILNGTGQEVDSELELTLYDSNGAIEGTGTVVFGAITTNDFNPGGLGIIDAGTYSLKVTGDRFVTTTYTDIIIQSGLTTTSPLDIDRNTMVTQTVSLSQGYNMASRRVHIDDNSMTNFLTVTADPVVDVNATSFIDFVKDDVSPNPNINYYFGTPLNNAVAWKTKKGYQFKNNTALDIEIPLSTPISYDADIILNGGGHTMIAYLPEGNISSTAAFADLKNAGAGAFLDYIRDTDGNTLIKINGNWVDHLGMCSPGEAFLVVWNDANPYTFNYPAPNKSMQMVEELEPVHFPFYAGYGNPTNNIYTMYVSGDILEEGDEIAVFDGDKLVGAKVIQENTDEFTNNLVAFTEMFDREGYTPGNAVVLKLWKASEDKEYWLNYDITNTSGSDYSYTGTTYPSGDAKFTQAEVVMSPLSIIDNLAAYINVYPNPANGFVNISSPENIDRLVIVNLVGQAVVDMSIGTTSTQVNVENLNSGIYFINMIIDGQRITKKLTIQ